jgi:hypothetical protein
MQQGFGESGIVDRAKTPQLVTSPIGNAPNKPPPKKP